MSVCSFVFPSIKLQNSRTYPVGVCTGTQPRLYSCISLREVHSGVTRVGVTRGGNWWVSLYFFWKKICVVSPSSYVVCPVFFLNSATENNFRSVVIPWTVSPGTIPPSDATGSPCERTATNSHLRQVIWPAAGMLQFTWAMSVYRTQYSLTDKTIPN